MGHRVLIVEDNASIAGLERRYLERDGFEVVHTLTGSEALSLLGKREQFDVLIIDYNLPDMSGVSLLQGIKGIGVEVPSIIVTAAGSEQVAVTALKLGAMDYIVKETETIKRLPETCRDVIKRFRLESENARLMAELKRVNSDLTEANLRLEDISRKDELTGSYNRRFLIESLGREVSRARRYGSPLSFAIFDLDHFKAVNDTHGHLTGDMVLKQFADCISARIRKTDIFGRYGGEEFGVVITDTSLEASIVLCEELREIVSRTRFGRADSQLSLTTSAGVGRYEQEMELDSLIDMADKGLYAAKAEGRNRIVSLQARGGAPAKRPVER